MGGLQWDEGVGSMTSPTEGPCASTSLSGRREGAVPSSAQAGRSGSEGGSPLPMALDCCPALSP